MMPMITAAATVAPAPAVGYSLLSLLVFALAAAVIVLTIRLRAHSAARHEAIERARRLASGRAHPADPTSELERAIDDLGRAVAAANENVSAIRGAVQEIFNGVGEGLLALDRRGRITLANDRVAELFALRTPVEGQRLSEVVRNAALLASLDEALRGRAVQTRASTVVRGQLRVIDVRLFPVRATSDLAVVALFIDQTEVERLQRIRRDFMTDFHHEVRTPLAGLRLAIESLQAGPLTEAQTEQLQKIVTRQVSRLERLVDEVGQLNEIESGELVLRREPTEMKALVADLAEDFREAASARGIEIEVDGDESVAEVDAAKAQQIVSNLIDNAIKHANGSSIVRVEVRDREDVAVVRVIDKGEGIPADEQEKIFHRFYRVDKSRSGKVEGTGLGLAIVKHLVLRHGGAIRVDSTPGQGATFEITFPKFKRRG